MQPAPTIVFTFGPYRSASTWVANVAADLLRRRGSAKLVYADKVASLTEDLDSVRQLVAKSHLPDPGLKLLVHMSRAPVIVSIREPLDCVASMMERFHEPFERALGAVAASASHTLSLFEICEPLVLRYENSSGRDEATVTSIANHIGVAIEDADATLLADRSSAASVDAFITKLIADGYFGTTPQVTQFHAETQWHPNHIGTGESGRFRAVLSGEQIEATTDATRQFRDVFGYEVIKSPTA